MNKSVSIFLCLLMCSTSISCISFKKNASKKSNSHYETFFINDSTMQYFIKPIDYKGQVDIQLDFTFRKINTIFSDVKLNFSVFSDTPNPIKSLNFYPNDSINISNIELMFKEKRKKKYVYRYTTIVSYLSLKDFFSKKYIEVSYNDNTLTPTKKSKNIIEKLNADLFNFELLN